MKATALYIAIFALALLTIPMIAINFDMDSPTQMQTQEHSPGQIQPSSAVSQTVPAIADPPQESNDENVDSASEASVAAQPLPDAEIPLTDRGVELFYILDESSGEVLEVSRQDFVRGAVAAEMPASFHAEALKAQAIAAHSFALRNHWVQQTTPDPALKGADFSADPTNLKVYITEEQARAFYGEKADQYWNKIASAADAVQDYVLEYEEEPIVAAYHAISAGKTEDASNVWSGQAPYLIPAESEGDLLAPDYESVQILTSDALKTALLSGYPDLVLDDPPETWLGEATRSDSGYVLELPVGNLTLQGKEIRQLLSLRSHHFEVSYSDGSFTFTVYGYGHGVGLSQYGADFLARQGSGYEQILNHYYSGAVLRQVSA